MPVKYLSQEWIDAYNAALAGDEAPAPSPGALGDHIQSAYRGQASSVSTTSGGPWSVTPYRPR